MPREVIMPALGMAQTTGLIVAWLKKPGEAVKKGDALMEVETDKAVMEVEAQADGFLTDVRVAAGDAAPVGDVVALISDSPRLGRGARATARGRRARAKRCACPSRAGGAEADPAKGAPRNPPPNQRRRRPAGASSPRQGATSGREQGLDLSRLVAAGAPQPYHVSDLETLRACPRACRFGAADGASFAPPYGPRARRRFPGVLRVDARGNRRLSGRDVGHGGHGRAALRRGASDEPLIVAAEALAKGAFTRS